MSRRVTLMVADDAALQPDVWYAMRVMKVDASKRDKRLTAVLQHLEGDHLGRCHFVEIPLPIRPYGQGAEFLRACGIDVVARKTAQPEDAVGKKVAVRLDTQDLRGPTVADFRCVDEEKKG